MPIRLKFSIHAQARMVEREFQVEHLKSAISEPDFTALQRNGNVKATKMLKDGKTITVIYHKDGFRGSNDYLVITAYYT